MPRFEVNVRSFSSHHRILMVVTIFVTVTFCGCGGGSNPTIKMSTFYPDATVVPATGLKFKVWKHMTVR